MVLGGKGCLISHLAAKLAFFPPRPPTYQVKNKEEGGVGGKVLVAVSSSIPHEDPSMDVRLLKTRRGNKIVCFYLKNPYARLTLLYSHGNAADLGQLYDLFVQLKLNLRVNLMGYDYSGYGASTGKPSEYDTYADIEAVYDCLQTEYGISQEDLILYGQSVGSGPTLHLAAKLPRLRGVVLHSAILSGLRVLCQLKCTLCFDIYKNINKIPKVKCPVLVIHGTEDDVVNWFHGDGLWQLAREPYEPLWIKGGGHCNLELYPDYIRHLCRFIQDMEKVTTKTRLKKIRQNLRLPVSSNATSTTTATKSNKCCRVRCCKKPKCLGCSSCMACPNCFSCSKCPSCSGCFSCAKCTSCSDCFCCGKCLSCSECFSCPKCPSCSECFSCSKCPSCSDCFSCAQCLSCSECFSCSKRLSCPKCLKVSTHNCIKFFCCR